jgi:hypothetical protein
MGDGETLRRTMPAGGMVAAAPVVTMWSSQGGWRRFAPRPSVAALFGAIVIAIEEGANQLQ